MQLEANVAINGPAMRHLRKLAGYSVKGLAEKAQCTPGYISLLETRAGRTCGPELFARICDALHLADRSVLVREPTETRSAA